MRCILPFLASSSISIQEDQNTTFFYLLNERARWIRPCLVVQIDLRSITCTHIYIHACVSEIIIGGMYRIIIGGSIYILHLSIIIFIILAGRGHLLCFDLRVDVWELLCQFLFLWLMNQLLICFSCRPVSSTSFALSSSCTSHSKDIIFRM